jgi:phosphoribosylglycinamide formyltransferase-1
MKWIVFFSQTGNEIVNITKKVNFIPDFIITNKANIKPLEINKLFSDKIYQIPSYPQERDYLNVFKEINIDKIHTLITLHGFLRIIPDKICNNYNIVNLHPGLINKYPELKGINPQKKATYLEHPIIGCVIHKVSPIVDGGEILLYGSENSKYNLTDNLKVLKDLSLNLWIQYLKSSRLFT